ncbi:NifU domain protein [Indibacter alkaliphilus LW1]|jgi:Fe-S cluster biogenesis protein NfuA|uniref:NifU domain protein n=1 Tax=Indibacter alkaliphilus (strain CCUG 57479 / KCTC 22604 / LW1) TaxID=1189612 RepID=S2DC14_INDAL|nr:NifU N-terminal domain-containing protein [Indibacter alkaliphilus]EOZ96464.1 NifU domain protein [Indibacter alkaliphilus LW1]
MLQAQKRPVHIYMEANPNPNSLKFVVNFMLADDGISFDYPDAASTENSPLAKELFNFAAVDRVFIASNFVTVTKKAEVEWAEIQDFLRNHIKSYLESGKAAVQANFDKDPLFDENDSETVKKIKGILDEYIRPAVEQDGGAIVFHSFHEGIVKVLLQGSCSGCPSSTVTLKAGIQNLLTRMLPDEVKEVQAEGV